MPGAAEKRRDQVFRAIVREYLRTAEPVGSETVFSKYHFGVSPATIRNDMVELEVAGLLEQPHTSAGRIPTERGYRFYVKTMMRVEDERLEREARQLFSAVESLRREAETAAKEFTRTVAALTEETVYMSLGGNRKVFAGVTYLVKKPEFREEELFLEISGVLDDFDHLVDAVSQKVDQDFGVLIGSENPFGEPFSTVMARYEAPRLGEGVIGILGPQRMDYDANVSLVRRIRELLSEI